MRAKICSLSQIFLAMCHGRRFAGAGLSIDVAAVAGMTDPVRGLSRRCNPAAAAVVLGVSLASFGLSESASAEGGGDLAKQSQNPLGTVISLPFESNFLFNIGPSDETAYLLNLKPVYPVRIGDWNMINRFVVPILYSTGQDAPVPPPADFDLGYGSVDLDKAKGSAFGLGDITWQPFFGPASPGKVTWGVAPVLVVPSATDDRYASDKWSAGVGAVALSMPGNWVIGVLAQNVWSFAGDSDASDVNKFLFQYFVNYNLDAGWYLTTSPVITANWEAASEDRWTVPFGGGIGRLVRFGNQPVDFKLAAYANAEHPENAPNWSLQLQVKFLFPK